MCHEGAVSVVQVDDHCTRIPASMLALGLKRHIASVAAQTRRSLLANFGLVGESYYGISNTVARTCLAHFRVRILPAQPASVVSAGHVQAEKFAPAFPRLSRLWASLYIASVLQFGDCCPIF